MALNGVVRLNSLLEESERQIPRGLIKGRRSAVGTTEKAAEKLETGPGVAG